MPLETEDRAWIARFLGNATPPEVWNTLSIYDELKARNAVERREIATARLAARAEVERRLEKHVGVLEEIAALELTVSNIDSESVKVSLMGSIPDEVYGHGYDRLKTSMDTHLVQFGVIVHDFATTTTELTTRTLPWSVLKNGGIEREERHLFDNLDAADATYGPFIRRGLFPEDQINAKFSRAQEMIDKSNRLYLEDLAEIEDEPEWQNTATQVQTILSGLGSVAIASLGVKETSDPAFHDTAKNIGTIITIVDISLKATTTAVVEISKKNAEDASKGIIDGLGQAIGKGVGGDAGKYIALGFKAAAQVPALVKTFRTSNSDGELASRLLAQLGDAIAIAVSIDNVSKSGDDAHTATQITAGIKSGLVVVGKAIEKDLIGAVKKARKGDTSALKRFAISYGAAVAREVTLAVTSAMSAEVIKAKKDTLDPSKNPSYQSTDEYKTFMKSIEGRGLTGTALDDEWKTYRGDLASTWSSSDSSTLASQTGSADAVVKALESILDGPQVSTKTSKLQEDIAMRDAIEYEEDDYLDALESLQDEPSREALERIGQLIAKIQKQRAIMSLVSGVVKTGAAGAARFWGAAAAAGTALDLALQIKLAVETHQELVTWRQSSEYAENAASPYFTSVISFVKEQERLYPRDVVKSIMLTVKMGAQIAQAEPTFGLAIGKLVEAIEGVAESAMDLICAQIDAAKVEKAWRITQMAFENPENRKAALIARKLNPTLAKYTIAWGAMVAKDVVAKEVCAQIGLTEGDLRAPDDKADDSVRILVSFLEIRYERHLQVKKHYEVEETTQLTWSKNVSIGSLVLETWLNLYSTALENGMVRQDPNKVSGALYDAWSLGSAFSREANELYELTRDHRRHLTAEQVNAMHVKAVRLTKAYGNAKKALAGFKPVLEDGTPDINMEAVLELYGAHIDSEEMNIEMSLSSLDMAVERERLTGFGDEELMRLARETEEASAQALVKDSLGLLNLHISAVEGCNHTDELDDLQQIYDEANEALEKIGKRKLVSEVPSVSSTAESLREKLAPLGRLIENLQAEVARDPVASGVGEDD
ncbi:hypothetical protein [Aporhodopirellula aestuarii]|uniref:Uncharacterized protein n=1 Tax=Aporhodopirellula aestuarii TaxID=2950107 RepID=A0ABT0TZ95_9BACT|nr:hypothetical protein [Aporhodopirellula aestuarii]MCM2369900.1 hypothetical protein [Aporhodopirellula aestuarii]